MSKISIWITVTLLLAYLLFMSGLFYWLSDREDTAKLITPYNWSLSAVEQGLTPIATEGDMDCVRWLRDKADQNLAITCDTNGVYLLAGWIVGSFNTTGSTRVNSMYDIEPISQCYVFLTDWNTRNSKYTRNISVGMRRHSSYSIQKTGNGELLLHVFDYDKEVQGSSQLSLVKEVYRSGNSVIYQKFYNINQEGKNDK